MWPLNWWWIHKINRLYSVRSFQWCWNNDVRTGEKTIKALVQLVISSIRRHCLLGGATIAHQVGFRIKTNQIACQKFREIDKCVTQNLWNYLAQDGRKTGFNHKRLDQALCMPDGGQSGSAGGGFAWVLLRCYCQHIETPGCCAQLPWSCFWGKQGWKAYCKVPYQSYMLIDQSRWDCCVFQKVPHNLFPLAYTWGLGMWLSHTNPIIFFMMVDCSVWDCYGTFGTIPI